MVMRIMIVLASSGTRFVSSLCYIIDHATYFEESLLQGAQIGREVRDGRHPRTPICTELAIFPLAGAWAGCYNRKKAETIPA